MIAPETSGRQDVLSRDGLLAALRGVEGWLGDDEAWELHSTVASMVDQGPLTVVEIGSWKGRSTIALALALPSSAHGRVVAIDPHIGSLEAEVHGLQDDTYKAFTDNLRRTGVDDRVTVMRLTSADAWQQMRGQKVDVLFLDGSHAYEDVVSDVSHWTANLVNGGIAAFNDWWQPEVWRALQEHVLSPTAPYAEARLIQGTLFAKKVADCAGRPARMRVKVIVALSHSVDAVLRALPPAVRYLVVARAGWKTKPELRRASGAGPKD